MIADSSVASTTIAGNSQSNSTPSSELPENNDWLDINMACGASFAVAVKKDGTVYGIGEDLGQFGFDTHTGNVLTLLTALPITNVKSVFTAGYPAICYAIKNDNTLHVSGGRSYPTSSFGCKNLGTGNTTELSTFTQTGNNTADWLKVVAMGNYQISYALKQDGTLWSCGEASGGLHLNQQPGLTLVFTQVGSATWLDVACGQDYFAGIKADGTLWVLTSSHTLGNGFMLTGVTAGILTQVGSATNWVALTNSMYADLFVINTAGELWGAGVNSSNVYSIGHSTFGNGSPDPLGILTKLNNDTGWQFVTNWFGVTHAVRNGQLYGTGEGWDGLSRSDTNIFTVVPNTNSLHTKQIFDVHGDLNTTFFITETRFKTIDIAALVFDTVGLLQAASVKIVGEIDGVLTVTGEGTWRATVDNKIIFSGEQGFFDNPTPIQYKVNDYPEGTLSLNFI